MLLAVRIFFLLCLKQNNTNIIVEDVASTVFVAQRYAKELRNTDTYLFFCLPSTVLVAWYYNRKQFLRACCELVVPVGGLFVPIVYY